MLSHTGSYGPAGTTVGRIENYRQQSQLMSLQQGLPFCLTVYGDTNDQVLAIIGNVGI
jgi:hypothetical protein